MKILLHGVSPLSEFVSRYFILRQPVTCVRDETVLWSQPQRDFRTRKLRLTLFAVFTSLCGVYEQMLPFFWCSKISCVAMFRSRATCVHT